MSATSAQRRRFREECEKRFTEEENRVITAALAVAEAAHEGQRRGTGEPYVCHSIAVAEILLEWRLDAPTITAALLHDVPEDTDVPLERLRAEFGEEIGDLVESVTKLSHIRLPQENVDFQVENLRRLFLAMAKDLRVVLLKLADRLHNMRTIEGVAVEKRERIGRETLEVYGPLADRLGMGEVRSELDDRGFRASAPQEYAWTKLQVEALYNRRASYMSRVQREFAKALKDEGITATISSRTKNLYSLHQKLLMKERDIDRIYDFFAVRVIVPTMEDCYHGMGIIHQLWQPLPHRIKDYIAVPKQNGYRSLHTTIFGPDKHLLEVQLRTEQMHREAELGVAAHAVYAEGKEARQASHEQLQVMKQLASWQDELKESTGPLENFKLDLFADRIFVFTPKGAPFSLPAGATPIDFAYHVHTEVGNTCTGAKVNGVIVPLDSILKNGDVVEVLTVRSSRPKRDWLQYVRTGHARSQIRGYFRKQAREVNLAAGKELLEQTLKRFGRTSASLGKTEWEKLTVAAGRDQEMLLVALGEGSIGAQTILRTLGLEMVPERKAPKPAGPAPMTVALSGLSSLLTKRAQCCNPQPPQPIIGYITLGKGISIHRASCPQVKNLPDPARLLSVSWED